MSVDRTKLKVTCEDSGGTLRIDLRADGFAAFRSEGGDWVRLSPVTAYSLGRALVEWSTESGPKPKLEVLDP